MNRSLPLPLFPALWLQLTMALPAAAEEADAPAWKAHSIDPRTEESRGADGVRLQDVNGDGWLDIAAGWEEARQSRVYLHPGAQKVRQPWPRVVVGREFGAPEDAVFCDLDGDGAVDVVSSSEGARLHFHWAPSDPAAYLEESAWETQAVEVGRHHAGMFIVPLQLDGRHGVDLVSGGKGKDLVWFQSPADPRDLSGWKRHVISSAGDSGWVMGIYAADIDGDGDEDIIWTARKGEAGGVRWMQNPGPGKAQEAPWQEHQLSSQAEDYMFGDVADVDGDGRLDVVAPVRDGELHFFRNLGEGQWQDVAIPSDISMKGAAVGDINLDGRMDIIVTQLYGTGPVWYEYEGEDPGDPQAWRAHLTCDIGGKTDLAALYDIDGDGDLDLLTTIESSHLQVMWYENPHAER